MQIDTMTGSYKIKPALFKLASIAQNQNAKMVYILLWQIEKNAMMTKKRREEDEEKMTKYQIIRNALISVISQEVP